MFFVLPILHAKIFNQCRFARTFYRTHPNIFEFNDDQTSLTVRPFYALSNQSFSEMNQSLSLGMIYRFAETYLVPVPLLFQCEDNETIYAPNDCEFTMIDTRVSDVWKDQSHSRFSSSFSQMHRFELLNLHVQQRFLFISKAILLPILDHYEVPISNNQQSLYAIVVYFPMTNIS